MRGYPQPDVDDKINVAHNQRMNNNIDNAIDRLYPYIITMRFNPKNIEWTVVLSDKKTFKHEYLRTALGRAIAYKFYPKKK